MLQFRQSDTSAVLILTLTELQTLAAPDFYFRFTHVLTKDTVTFTKTSDEEESQYTQRYNMFTINPSVVFADKPIGEWHYRVYENDANGALLEHGKLLVKPATDFEHTKYEGDNSFKTYNG